MIALANSHLRGPARRAAFAVAAWLVLLALPWLGCAGASPTPAGSVLEADRIRGAKLPNEIDQYARRVLESALAAPHEESVRARDAFAAAERERGGETGLLPYFDHLVAATSDDAIAYRAACLSLLEQDGLDDALREFLEVQVEDDPLRLAQIRISDSRKKKGVRFFNAFASAAGRSMLTMNAAPARMAGAAVNLAIAHHMDDPISVPERQALHHWRRYVEVHPRAPETPQIIDRIESAQLRWFAMKRKRSLRAARKGLAQHQNRVAFLLAERALRYDPENGEAIELRAEAKRRLRHTQTLRARSLEATPTLSPVQTGDAARRFAEALLDPSARLLEASERVLASGVAELAPEARFARAIALGEAGHEEAAWEALRDLAHGGPGIANHARALMAQPTVHPYRAFRRAIALDRKDLVGQVVLGPMAKGPRRLDLPRPLEWMIDGPSFVGTLGGIPQRLLQTAMKPPPSKRPAVHGYRYLKRYPDGEHAVEVRKWLFGHESRRENWVAAHALALALEKKKSTLTSLREKAATQGLESARRQDRRDLKLHFLNEVARRYPNTKSGDEAKREALEQLHSAATQQIRISRGFLMENPRVAGADGLGLRPQLLDKDRDNGELHPDGVTLLGGRQLEIALLAPSGGDDDDPEVRRETLSEERLGRLVALLDETAIHNALVDPLAGFEADADRDLFFERARLGVAERKDLRPAAASSYAFVGVREKYTMVRTHEPLLPFDLVVQGSFPDLGFGAFPRLRAPEATSDAILYR